MNYFEINMLHIKTVKIKFPNGGHPRASVTSLVKISLMFLTPFDILASFY